MCSSKGGARIGAGIARACVRSASKRRHPPHPHFARAFRHAGASPTAGIRVPQCCDALSASVLTSGDVRRAIRSRRSSADGTCEECGAREHRRGGACWTPVSDGTRKAGHRPAAPVGRGVVLGADAQLCVCGQPGRCYGRLHVGRTRLSNAGGLERSFKHGESPGGLASPTQGQLWERVERREAAKVRRHD